MKRAIEAHCFEMRPKDRDYNKHNGRRETQMEIMPDGCSYCIRTGLVYGVIIVEEEDEGDGMQEDIRRRL